MGVFEKSKFIWINDTESVDTYAEFHTKMQITGSPVICNISVDGDYTLFVNGKFVASNQYGDYEHYKIFDEIDITEYLCAGRNELFLLVWHFGADSQRYKKAEAGVIFEIEQVGDMLIASDERISVYLNYLVAVKRKIACSVYNPIDIKTPIKKR